MFVDHVKASERLLLVGMVKPASNAELQVLRGECGSMERCCVAGEEQR